MPELFKQPSSRIVQIDGEHALCEDGSVWLQQENHHVPYMWILASPPHGPPKQSADLAEALTVLSNLLNCAEPNSKTGWEYYKDAEKFLDKHGA